MWTSGPTEIYTTIFPHIQRTRELSIRIELGVSISNATDLLKIDMPYLNTLDLYGPSVTSTSNGETSHYAEIPNPKILQNVQNLILNSFGFRWDQIGLRNLTVLHLLGDFHSHHRPSVQQILRTLSLSPALEDLRLQRVAYDDDYRSMADIMISDFHLPRLMILWLWTNGPALAKAIVNPSVLPKLTTSHFVLTEDDESTMINILLSYSRTIVRRPLSKINVSIDSEGGGKQMTLVATNVYNGHHLSFFNGRNNSSHFDPTDILLVMEELDVGSLEEFRCLISQPLWKQWWRNLLGRAPGLKQLHTHDFQDPAGLIAALWPEYVGSNETIQDDIHGGSVRGTVQQPYIFLPSLTKLTFTRAAFAPSTLDAWDTDSAQYKEGSLDHLTDCLKQLMECGFMQDTVQLLEVINRNIEWELSTFRLKSYVETLEVEDEDHD